MAVVALGLVVRSRRRVPAVSDTAVGDDVGPAQPEGEKAPRELLAAWVAFLKSDLTEAVNALHNRLGVIALAATSDDPRLTTAQKENLERIKSEVARAAKITSGLLRRVNADAPDSMPKIQEEYDVSKLGFARILLVESDDSHRVVLTKLFERLGHRVSAVSYGLEAYEIIRVGDLDCIIADLRLPYAGGRTLFEQIEQSMPQMASRFVFVTGDYTNPQARSFLDGTGQPVIGKPYELVELLGAMAQVMVRHAATRNA